MKKYLYLLGVLSVLVSCSPETDPGPAPEEEPVVNLQVETSQISVDQVVTLTVHSDEPLQQIAHITDNEIHTLEALEEESLPGTFQIYFKFPSPGTQNVNLQFTFTNGAIITRELQFDVERGNTVQITKVEVNSFKNINGSWDIEFEEKDPERLADVVFSLQKLVLPELDSEEGAPGKWFLSEIRLNQNNLVWNLSEEDLFIDPIRPFFFGLNDDDGGTSENLLERPARQIFLKDYIESRPESISLVDPSTDLNVRFYLNWP